jgi:hypothetical protein
LNRVSVESFAGTCSRESHCRMRSPATENRGVGNIGKDI